MQDKASSLRSRRREDDSVFPDVVPSSLRPISGLKNYATTPYETPCTPSVSSTLTPRTVITYAALGVRGQHAPGYIRINAAVQAASLEEGGELHACKYTYTQGCGARAYARG